MDKVRKAFYVTLNIIALLLAVLWVVMYLYNKKEFNDSTNEQITTVTVVDKYKIDKYRGDEYIIVISDGEYEFTAFTSDYKYYKIEVGAEYKLKVRYYNETGLPVNNQKLKIAK